MLFDGDSEIQVKSEEKRQIIFLAPGVHTHLLICTIILYSIQICPHILVIFKYMLPYACLFV